MNNKTELNYDLFSEQSINTEIFCLRITLAAMETILTKIKKRLEEQRSVKFSYKEVVKDISLAIDVDTGDGHQKARQDLVHAQYRLLRMATEAEKEIKKLEEAKPFLIIAPIDRCIMFVSAMTEKVIGRENIKIVNKTEPLGEARRVEFFINTNDDEWCIKTKIEDTKGIELDYKVNGTSKPQMNDTALGVAHLLSLFCSKKHEEIYNESIKKKSAMIEHVTNKSSGIKNIVGHGVLDDYILITINILALLKSEVPEEDVRNYIKSELRVKKRQVDRIFEIMQPH